MGQILQMGVTQGNEVRAKSPDTASPSRGGTATGGIPHPSRVFAGSLACLIFLFVALIWAYWDSLSVMADKWNSDPQYSHGYLVPLFGLVLLWIRRDRLDPLKLNPSLWGLPALALGLAMRFAAVHFYIEWFDQLSLIPCVLGVALLVGGFELVRWAWPAIVFLIFMIPLPYSLEGALREPLRTIGTKASTYLMQTVGLPAFAEGQVILVNDVRIGVVEACSGLRMLMVFFALSSAVAFLSQRTVWERVLIALSALPIAIAANVLRITATGALHATGHTRLADFVFHDFAGWMMMPLALAMLGIELWILSRLFLVDEDRPLSVEVPGDSDRASVAGSATLGPARSVAATSSK
jgi:exosortase